MSKIDILLPTKGRPHKIPELRKNIEDTTSSPYVLTFVAEESDKPTVEALEGDEEAIITVCGSASKAVNAAFKQTDAPYFIFWNDDFEAKPGWDTKALAKMNDEVSVVAINDGNPGEVQWGTITLVKRSYITDHGGTENKGEVFHEGYNHFYCDTEMWDIANKRGVADTAPDSVIIHKHPAFGYPGDKLHKKKGMEKDSQLFMARKQLDL